MTITTTLSAIRKHHPCKDGWEKLLASLGKTKADDEPLAFGVILESNGLDDALWCLRALGPEHHKRIVSLACDFAERALKFAPADEQRPAECIRITRLWIDGQADLSDLLAAKRAAARAAAEAAARAAARAEAAGAAAWAAAVAADAAAGRADAEARGAEKKWQAARFVEVMTTN